MGDDKKLVKNSIEVVGRENGNGIVNDFHVELLAIKRNTRSKI